MKKVQLAITREEAEFILDWLNAAKNESVELMDYNQKKINEVSSGETIDLYRIKKLCENGIEEQKNLEIAWKIESKIKKLFPPCPF